MKLRLDKFAFRQWDDVQYSGTRLRGISKEDFMKHVTGAEPHTLVDGYTRKQSRSLHLSTPAHASSDSLLQAHFRAQLCGRSQGAHGAVDGRDALSGAQRLPGPH